MIALLCRDGQGGGATIGFEVCLELLARFGFAATAAGGAAGARLQLLETARALRHGAADVLVGDGLADADVHGG